MKKYAFIKFPYFRVTKDIRFNLILRAIFYFTLTNYHTRFNNLCDLSIVFTIVRVTKTYALQKIYRFHIKVSISKK